MAGSKKPRNPSKKAYESKVVEKAKADSSAPIEAPAASSPTAAVDKKKPTKPKAKVPDPVTNPSPPPIVYNPTPISAVPSVPPSVSDKGKDPMVETIPEVPNPKLRMTRLKMTATKPPIPKSKSKVSKAAEKAKEVVSKVLEDITEEEDADSEGEESEGESIEKSESKEDEIESTNEPEEELSQKSAEKSLEEKEDSVDEVEESEKDGDPVGEGQSKVEPVGDDKAADVEKAASPVVGGVPENISDAVMSKAEGKRKVVSGVTPRSVKRKLLSEDSPRMVAAGDVPDGVVFDGVWFATAALSRQWEVRKTWPIIQEKVMVVETWDVPEALRLVKNSGLLKSLTMPKPAVLQIVLEAAANISPEFGEPGHPEYGVLYVRKEKVVITPSVINSYFGIGETEYIDFPELGKIAEIITGGKKKSWDAATTLRSNQLTSLYAVLFTFCAANWIPTKNKQAVSPSAGRMLYAVGQQKKVNLGAIAFDILADLGTQLSAKKYIGYPSMIYELVIQQAGRAKQPTERPVGELLKFLADHKLFGGEHVVDVERVKPGKPSVKTEYAGPSTRSASAKSAPVSKRTVAYLERKYAELKAELKEVAGLLGDIRYPAEVNSEEEENSEDGSE